MPEPLQGIYIPDNTLTPLGGSQIAQSITELARKVVMQFATAAARDAAITAAGLTSAQKQSIIAWQDDTNRWYGCDDGTTWIELGGRRQRAWSLSRGATDNYVATGPLSFITVHELIIASAPAGDYDITSTLGMGATATNAGTVRMTANGTNICGDLPLDLGTSRIPVSLNSTYQLAATGTLTINISHQPTGATNTIYVGSKITASWLGPR